MCEPTTKRYMFHGIFCDVYTTWETLQYYPAFPWRFKLICRDRTIHFEGMPNYCMTARSAMMRGLARCKWIADGTYSERYSTSKTLQENEQ